MRDITHIVLHSTLQRPNEPFLWEELVADHHRRGVRSGAEGGPTAYHYTIERDGTVRTGRYHSQPARLSGNLSEEALAICMVGGLDSNGEPSPASFSSEQWRALFDLVNHLLVQYPQVEIVGHRDVYDAPKANALCPCFDAETFGAIIKNLEKRERS